FDVCALRENSNLDAADLDRLHVRADADDELRARGAQIAINDRGHVEPLPFPAHAERRSEDFSERVGRLLEDKTDAAFPGFVRRIEHASESAQQDDVAGLERRL